MVSTADFCIGSATQLQLHMAKKKISENPKAVESRERKANSKKDIQVQEKNKTEDEFWQEAGEGAKSKASKKKDEQAKEREAAAAKKAEAKQLAAEEDAAMAKLAKKAPKKANSETKVDAWLSYHPIREVKWPMHIMRLHACFTGHLPPAAATARSRQEGTRSSC